MDQTPLDDPFFLLFVSGLFDEPEEVPRQADDSAERGPRSAEPRGPKRGRADRGDAPPPGRRS